MLFLLPGRLQGNRRFFFFRKLPRTGPIRMRAVIDVQFFIFRAGVGVVPGRQFLFFLGVVGLVDSWGC